jgi:hypothetical protein
MMTTSLLVGRSKPGCGLCPALSFKDLHHPHCGGGRAEPGFYLPHGPATCFFLRHSGEKGILQLCGGGALQSCGRKANCCCQARVCDELEPEAVVSAWTEAESARKEASSAQEQVAS